MRLWIGSLLGALALTAALAAPAAASTSVSAGVVLPAGATGFGGNVSAGLIGFGPLRLRAVGTVAVFSKAGVSLTQLGLGADFVGLVGRGYLGGGANVFFSNASFTGAHPAQTNFVPDLLAGVNIFPMTSLEARYYIEPDSIGGGTFFAGLRFQLP